MDLDDPRVGNVGDSQTAFNSPQQGRGAWRIQLQVVRRQTERISRRNVSLSAILRALVQVQLLDYLQGEQVTPENLYFRVDVGLVVVIAAGIGILEIQQAEIGLIDGDTAEGVVNRRHAESRNQHEKKYHYDAGDHHEATLDEHPQVLAQHRFLHWHHGRIKAGRNLGELQRHGLELARSEERRVGKEGMT